VVIISHEDIRRYNSNPAGSLQGRLAGYPQWPNFAFTQCGVGKTHGVSFGITLVIRDSSVIAFDAPYGIPADKENFVIATCVEWYRIKKQVPQESVRDNKDAA
jgi:D-serine dehydratase